MKRLNAGIKEKILRKPRIPDARISMTSETLIIEYSNGMDLILASHDHRAQQVINFIKLK